MRKGKIKRIILVLGFAIAISLFAQEKPADQPQPQPGQTIEKPKAYGCYKDLRWGMNFEDAQKALGFKLKKWPIKMFGEETAFGDDKIGNTIYSIMLDFNKEGLFRVRIASREQYQSVQLAIDNYKSLKPALIDKFGKPQKDIEENLGKNVDFGMAVLNQQARLYTEWQTDESLIILRVEAKAKGALYELLTYEKKAPQKKIEL